MAASGRKSILLFLLIILTISNTSAQNLALIDSLKRILPKQSPADQFESLNKIGFEYRISKQDSAYKYCNLAYLLGKKIKITTGLAKPLNFIGLAHTNEGNYKKAIEYYYQAIEVCSQQNDSLQLAHSYNNLARAFFDLGDITRAYDNLILSRNIFERIHDKAGLAYVFRSLANIFRLQKNDSEALEMSSRALELRKQLGDKRTLASAFMELGLLYQSMKNIPLSLQKLKQADSVAAMVNDKLTRAEIGLGIAENLFEINQQDSAFHIATRVLALVQLGKNYKLFLRSSMLCARYHIYKGNDADAIAILTNIEADSTGYALASVQRDAAALLLGIYKKRNNKVGIEKFSNRFTILNEKLENTDLRRQVDQLKFRVELEKKETENRQLKFKSEQDKILITQQRTENIFLLLFAILVGLIGLLGWIYSRKRQRDNFKLEIQNQEIIRQREEIKNQNESLSIANRELSELNHEKDILMSIVAHDLKSPINRIYALARILELEGNLTQQQLEYIRLVKLTAIGGIDLITGLLDVTALEASDLKPTLSEVNIQELINNKAEFFTVLAHEKNIKLGVHVNIDQPITSDAGYISRIVDNLLSNALKFSHEGTTIAVSVTSQPGLLILSVKDQGQGFSSGDKKQLYQKFKKLTARPTAGESSNGLGLAIVKTLVDRLKGQIELKSELGSGSEFIVRLPIQ